ncbi:hypothetical protein [Nocardia sp. CA-120079]|uniref:hypothetical protein n=1 Tax=Nocardia sp. CA-120079 TaxID=3239974 RepID=UPI003D9705BA
MFDADGRWVTTTERRGGLDQDLAGEDRATQLAILRKRMNAVTGRVDAADAAGVPALDVLTVPGPLGALLPAGGLVRGTTVGCTRGSVLTALVAAATAAGKSAAIVGGARFGFLAAHEMGARLDRLFHVRNPGPDALSIVSTLADDLDMVVLDLDELTTTPSQVRPVQATVRNKKCVWVVVTSGRVRGIRPDLQVTARPIGYSGLDTGRGLLREIHLEVRVSERAGPSHTAHLNLRGDGTGVHWIEVDQHSPEARPRLHRTG